MIKSRNDDINFRFNTAILLGKKQMNQEQSFFVTAFSTQIQTDATNPRSKNVRPSKTEKERDQQRRAWFIAGHLTVFAKLSHHAVRLESRIFSSRCFRVLRNLPLLLPPSPPNPPVIPLSHCPLSLRLLCQEASPTFPLSETSSGGCSSLPRDIANERKESSQIFRVRRVICFERCISIRRNQR